MKLKNPLLKRTGILFLICALSLTSLLIQNVQTTSAASYHFHKDSITSKNWSSIKPKVRKWIQRAVPYASPCSGLIDWENEAASGLDCSGFVNTMVRLYYNDGQMRYDWQSFFASDTWAGELTEAGLRLLGSDQKEDFILAYKRGKIQDGDIVVFRDGEGNGAHVALVYGKDKEGGILLAHEYGDHLQTTPFHNVYDWDFEAGNYAYYEVFSGTPRKAVSTAKTQKSVAVRTVSSKKLHKKSQYISIKSHPVKFIRKIYQKLSVSPKAKKYIAVSKNGIVKLKKGLRKGTYPVKVKITTINTKNQKSHYEIKTLKIRVK